MTQIVAVQEDLGVPCTKQLTQSFLGKRQKGYKEKESSIPITRIMTAANAKLRLMWWSTQGQGLLLRVGWPGDLPMDKR